jgi:hypothetical protein
MGTTDTMTAREDSMSYEQQLKKWRTSMEKSIKEAFAKPKGGSKLLVRAGILEPGGKRLAKPYRK